MWNIRLKKYSRFTKFPDFLNWYFDPFGTKIHLKTEKIPFSDK